MRIKFLLTLALFSFWSFRQSDAQTTCSNDSICNALELGQLVKGGRLGDASNGIFQNTCGTSNNDPNPADNGAWENDAGVWFHFTTGDNPGPLLTIEAINDPEATGDDIDLQLAVYRSGDGTCTGQLNFEDAVSDNAGLDGTLTLFCIEPNTSYYILVDGGYTAAGNETGVFGMEVRSYDVEEAQDDVCSPEAIGAVPEGGFVAVPGLRSNFCATSENDPSASAFATQVTVWFTFQAPSSGSVTVTASSEGLPFPLGAQLAIYSSSNGRCTGEFYEIGSTYSGDDGPDETLQVTCLDPGATYYLMVDGFGRLGKGMFNLLIRDPGATTPMSTIDTTICAGRGFAVGDSYYIKSGVYFDTLQMERGCDSIVQTNLTVLDPIILEVDVTEPAVWNGAPGAASLSATGGTGGYDFHWCDGNTTTFNDQLPAGETCFIYAVDDFGCGGDTFFVTPFVTVIDPSFEVQPVRCGGDSTGVVTLSAGNGLAPYTYTYETADGDSLGQGAIPSDTSQVLVEGLPLGTYRFTVADNYSDTSFTVAVTGPEPLQLQTAGSTAPSCFDSCDGSLTVAATGGTGNYSFQWDNGTTGTTASGLCLGKQAVTVIDNSGCEFTDSLLLEGPSEIIVSATMVQPVSCFGSTDGIAQVTASGNPVSYAWSNGSDSTVVSGLSAGVYLVTVTDATGCDAVGEVAVTQPEDSLRVEVQELHPVSCPGASDGELNAQVSGAYQSLGVQWTDDSGNIVNPKQLPSGIYKVEVRNQNGCSAMANYVLTEPNPIVAEVVANDVSCLDPNRGGVINIQNPSGGYGRFSYSVDGEFFQQGALFSGLAPGAYDVAVRDSIGCEVVYPVAIEGPQELEVSLGGDQTVSLGDTLRLTAKASNNGVAYEWEPAGIIAGDSSGSSVFIAPVQSDAFRVTIRDTVTQCTASDVVYIMVQKNRRVYIPNAFSPNGDGLNDTFEIYSGNGVESIRNLRIFSRSGALVYEVDNPVPNATGQGWDGNFRGQALPAGVYVYMAEIGFVDGIVEMFKGEVVLMR